jgi:putative transposase
MAWLKHEDICLKGYADGREAHAGFASRIEFYNHRRAHQGRGLRANGGLARRRSRPEACGQMDNSAASPTCPRQQRQTQPLTA